MSENQYSTILLLSFAALVLMTMLWYLAEYKGEREASGDEYEHQMVNEVMSLLEAHYDGPVDRTELLEGGLQGIAESLNDRYTMVRVPEEVQDAGERMSGSFVGIGVTIQSLPDGRLRVTSVVPSHSDQRGPAYEAGIKRGDIIAGVNGETLLGVDTLAASRLIKGEEGTEVRLTIERDAETLEITVVRGLIQSPVVRGLRMLPPPSGSADLKVGYMRLDAFTRNAPEQMQEAYQKLLDRGMERFVLDLRGNGGGLLDACIQIADMFIAEEDKLILSTRAASETKRSRGTNGADFDWSTTDDEALITLPTVILLDRGTASASEVLAGALQDYELAYLIGERSYGKGVVQNSFKLKTDPRYELKITIASYFTPLGNRLLRTGDEPGGIEPDLYIPLSDKEYADLQIRQGMEISYEPIEVEHIEDKRQREAWSARDLHIEAVYPYFLGQPVAVSLEETPAG